MPLFAKLFLVGLAVMAAFAAISEARHRKKLYRRLEAEFGKSLSPDPGLMHARAFWEAYAKNTAPQAALDEITWSDLDMDAVYGAVNCCQSGVGNLWLYTRLRTSGVGDGQGPDQRELTAFFAREHALRRKVQYRLAKLGRKSADGIEAALFNAKDLQLAHPALLVLLACLPLVSFLCWPILGIRLGSFVSIVLLLANFFVTFYLRNLPGSGFYPVCSFASALFCAEWVAGLLKNKEPALFGELALTAKRFRGLAFPLSLIQFSDRSFQMGILDVSSFFLLPVLSYMYLIGRLDKRRTDCLGLVRLLGGIDAAIGVLSLQKMLPVCCAPCWTQEKKVEFTNVFHPLLEEPVANSACFERGVLFTGSNASGKSTFIKAVAVNCILGQAIDTCFAQAFCMHRGFVLTSMALRDNIFEGKSYFITELQSIRRILEQVRKGAFCYIFMDEILRGTNAVERISASCAVLKYLCGEHCLVMAATHDLELTKVLEPYYENCHFRERIEGGNVLFDYKLHKGPSATRNALRLMETMQYPPQVLGEAARLAQRYESTGGWTKNLKTSEEE